MAIIHLIDGEKGGVGKSFIARTMIQYGLDRDFPFSAVESDRSNPDVSRVYKDICQFAIFSEEEKQKVIDFPKLGHRERYLINRHQLRFDHARESKELTILGKQRVVNFLKAAYETFDSTGVWSKASANSQVAS